MLAEHRGEGEQATEEDRLQMGVLDEEQVHGPLAQVRFVSSHQPWRTLQSWQSMVLLLSVPASLLLSPLSYAITAMTTAESSSGLGTKAQAVAWVLYDISHLPFINLTTFSHFCTSSSTR
jgi:hypothetical protein